jgi:hypothetical protein
MSCYYQRRDSSYRSDQPKLMTAYESKQLNRKRTEISVIEMKTIGSKIPLQGQIRIFISQRSTDQFGSTSCYAFYAGDTL